MGGRRVVRPRAFAGRVYTRALPRLRKARLGRSGVSATSNTPSPRSAAERALIESERYFRTLMEQSSDIVVLIDIETRLLYTSPSIERVLGFTPDRSEERRVGKEGRCRWSPY